MSSSFHDNRKQKIDGNLQYQQHYQSSTHRYNPYHQRVEDYRVMNDFENISLEKYFRATDTFIRFIKYCMHGILESKLLISNYGRPDK